MGSTRLSDHRRREVQPDRVGTPGRGRGGEEPRSARDVEQARTGADACGVEHRIHGLPGQAPECVRIMPGGAFPPGVLEIAKLVLHVDASIVQLAAGHVLRWWIDHYLWATSGSPSAVHVSTTSRISTSTCRATSSS